MCEYGAMPDTTFLIALCAAILSAASIVLHVVAPRTKNTWDDKLRDDVDEVLSFARAQKTATPLAVVPPRSPQAGFIDTAILRALGSVGAFGVVLGLVFGLSCGATSKAVGKAVLADAVDCTTVDRVKLEGQFGPTVELALQRAMGGDGKIDLPSLNEIGRSLEADGWCVLEKSVLRLLFGGAPGTASAAAPLDAADLRAKVSTLRAAKFGATQFQFGRTP